MCVCVYVCVCVCVCVCLLPDYLLHALFTSLKYVIAWFLVVFKGMHQVDFTGNALLSSSAVIHF